MGVEPNSAKTPNKNKMETGIPVSFTYLSSLMKFLFLAFSLLGLEDWELAITRIGPLVIVKAKSQLSNLKPKPSKEREDEPMILYDSTRKGNWVLPALKVPSLWTAFKG
ncbi:hypothetical protein VNO80_33875 [Phaseolus coccineus]|uniref:Uncharacterized protein n=1 Tax=Phaseolus coccineus TaxID=3886 RepID=A0AAN9KY77_PHACN